ncbi:short-chain dehydrogenase/reductase SDR [Mycena epipterygia]|nr:short-chain dehydrogenase/reductase SDR [Mycena epipterygia]
MFSISPSTKIVLITGANKGIGFEIAKQLAQRGYHVLLGSRDAERGARAAETLQKAGLSVEAVTIDVADDESIQVAAQIVHSRFGRLDVLINNVGIGLDSFGGEPSSRAIFEQTFAVNVFGAAATTEAFVPLLEKSSTARLVFVSSNLGSLASYARSRSGPINIHNPGFTATDLTKNLGTGTVEDGAKGAVRLATLANDGETGTYSEKEAPLPW